MKKYFLCLLVSGLFLLLTRQLFAQWSFRTDYFTIKIDDKGYITSMKNSTLKPAREFSPVDQPSPVLSLYDEELKRYYYPHKASYNKNSKRLSLEYSNGSIATVQLEEMRKYFKLKLIALSSRKNINAVQWGNYYTSIRNLFGEIIGVARDTSAHVSYAIGVLALNDNTIGGEARYTSETGAGGYIAHSPDPVNHPLPLELHEGQQFTWGGDGINDVAFYNRKESYYRTLYGNTAGVDYNGRINIRYCSRDRRKGKMIYSPEGVPILLNNEPNHLKRQDVPGVDYIGSAIALWGSPDSTALMDVIQDIVLKEGLPYVTFKGRWVKDPAAFKPDITTYGNQYDSMASYAKQMGLSVIHAYDHPFLKPDRGNAGYLDGRGEERKPFRFTTGNLSHREYANVLAKSGLILGRTSITNSLAPGTKDASPVPSDSICVQHRRFLKEPLSATDTLIFIDDPTHLEEIACWEGHTKELNMVKIGKQLIHYLGVSAQKPYRLLNVTRGYWNSKATAHSKGDAVDKLQVTVGGSYQGLVPDLELQDEIARHYADIAANSGLGMYDLDGQEFLFHSGFGAYSVKRFFRNVFAQAKKYNLEDIRFTGATLSEGSWHYQSIWNVGGGKNIYDADLRVWGSTTSQGKDLRDVTFANFFPSSFGSNFPITKNSTAEQYEHIQAIAVGVGTTYSLRLSQKDVESCPQKDAIFNVIRTWENARAANAFPRWLKAQLSDPAKSWRLDAGADKNTWTLYQMIDGKKTKPLQLKRATGY